jgi:peroxiredoxin
VELQSRVEELNANGMGLVGISYDSQQTLADFSERNGITFPLLSDVGSATIRRYGILNTVAEEALGPNGSDAAVLADFERYVSVTSADERFRGIPYPGMFIVDQQGRVTSREFEDYYWERNTVSSLMLALGAGATPVQATQVSTAHLEINAYASDAQAALGTRFSLAVDITPKGGMHVYAPGATDYRIVSLNITPEPHLRTEAAQYPESEIYYFAPLDERVPVFQQPFTLRVEAVAEATAAARQAFAGRDELVIAGTLEYQACDDAICYNPVSVPLSWTIALDGYVPGAPRPAQ